MSANGMRLLSEAPVDIWTGQEIAVESFEFGIFRGKVLWRSPEWIGVELNHSLEPDANRRAYWRYFGKIVAVAVLRARAFIRALPTCLK
jgi:hypothetical protein